MNDRDQHEKFHRLLWPHRAAVLRSAVILSRDLSDAEDLAQETMIKAYRAADRFVEGTDALAWLLTILRNTRIDRLRADARRADDVSLDQAAHDLQAPEDSCGMPGDRLANPQLVLDQFSDARIIDALRQLPGDICWTLLLVDVQGMNHADAASVLDVPTGTVKSRAHRGRTMLRQALATVAKDLRLIR